MMKNKKILFPTDFSKASVRALKDTVALNQQLDFELIILHSYSRPYSEGYDQQGPLERAEKNVERQFEKIAKEIPSLGSQNHRFVKILGEAVDAVEELVEKASIGIIVMSTKGAIGLGELFGTKTAKIIKSVTVPVMIIPTDASLMPIDKLGLACDYSDELLGQKLDFLMLLAEKMNLSLDLITLNRDEKTMTKKELKNRDDLLNTMSHMPVKVTFTQHPHLSTGLIAHAKANELGIIGIIPKSYNFMERLFHESLTERMAFHSPIPVLVLQ